MSPQASLGVKKPSRALLYVILSPVGSYFSTGVKPVSLWADPKYIRAWRGGTGDCKMGGYTHTHGLGLHTGKRVLTRNPTPRNDYDISWFYL